MQSFSLGQNQISILPGRRPDAPVIYLPSVKDEGACISRYLLESGCPDLTLISISDLSWNHDMAPWDCPAVCVPSWFSETIWLSTPEASA